MIISCPRLSWILAQTLFILVNSGGHALAGGWFHGQRGAGQVAPGRGQYYYIRDGLGPDMLPYTRQGHWGLDHRYPKYPLFHGPIPAGPGDCLYETGLFPWQRG